MKNFAKGKIITILSLTLTLSIVAACGMLASTYAKYTEKFAPYDSITVAKWDFLGDNSEVAVNMDIKGTYDTSTLVDGKIAPGTSGSFPITMKSTNTETGVAYTIKLEDIEKIPTNLKFYKDQDYTQPLTLNSNAFTGTLQPNDSTGVTHTVYWNWEYETEDEQHSTVIGDGNDTADGKNANELTVKVTITGTQVQPQTK